MGAGYLKDSNDGNGLIWNSLPVFNGAKGATIRSITISGGSIYFGGFITNSLSVNVPVYWKDANDGNGAVLHILPVLDSSKTSYVYSIVVSGGSVYAGGYSTYNNGTSNIIVSGYWKDANDGNGGIWTPLPDLGYSNSNAGVWSMVITQ